MSDLDNKDFDLMVRSAMEDGEEKVPAGVWESVESRLDADGKAVTGQRRRRFGWVLGLAVAGAATILVMLRPAGIEEKNVAEEIAVAAAQEAVELPVTEEIVEVVEVRAEKKAVAKAAEKVKVAQEDVAEEMDVKTAVKEEAAQKEETIAKEVTAFAGEKINSPEYGFTDDKDSDVWEKIEKSRMKGWKAQFFAMTSTGGNLGKHNRSLGRSASRSVDFGSSQITENECTFVSIPVSVGIGIKVHFNDHWALGAGINYTYLGRKFSGTYDDGAIEKYTCPEISNDQHYFGIPINVYFNFAAANRLKFYAFAGGAVDKCVANKYWFDYGGSPMYLTNSVKGFQYSVTLGAGMQYNFNDLLSIYIDPDFKYYFENSKQPKSIRTTQPFQIGCELGLRFNL